MCPAMLSGIVVFAKVDSDQSCSRFLSDELIIQGPHFPERLENLRIYRLL